MYFELVKLDKNVNIQVLSELKNKFWFCYAHAPKNRLMLKYSREKTGEHWSEKCAAEFCHLLDIPHANYDLAIYNGKFGVITQDIIPSGFRMLMGNEALYDLTKDYPPPQQLEDKFVRVEEHTVTRVLGYLENESIQTPPSIYNLSRLNAADVFCGYLMLDALISNQDRHHENWAIMLDNETGEQFLCPTYDHAASLGREMLDDERNERLTTKDKNRQIPSFVKKARSELFKAKTDKKTLSTVEAFQHAVEERSAARDHWLAKLSALTEDSITEVFNQVPASCISDSARKFAALMVMENRRRLLK